jgi:hypothetical protein
MFAATGTFLALVLYIIIDCLLITLLIWKCNCWNVAYKISDWFLKFRIIKHLSISTYGVLAEWQVVLLRTSNCGRWQDNIKNCIWAWLHGLDSFGLEYDGVIGFAIMGTKLSDSVKSERYLVQLTYIKLVFQDWFFSSGFNLFVDSLWDAIEVIFVACAINVASYNPTSDRLKNWNTSFSGRRLGSYCPTSSFTFPLLLVED